MRRIVLFLCPVIAALVVSSAAGSASSGQNRWVIRDLGTLGGKESSAYALNDRGQIVGVSDTKRKDADGLPVGHAFLWQNGRMRDLGALGSGASYPSAINERGQVVGTSDTKRLGNHAVIWQDGKIRDLGTLGGSDSSGSAINQQGQIVGTSFTKSFQLHAFLWENGKMRDLGTLSGSESDARAISSDGRIVGYSDTPTHTRHAFLWEWGAMRDLGTLGGTSEAWAINASGQVVGVSDRADAKAGLRAFLWENGTMSELPMLPPPRGVLAASQPAAINDQGRVVGSCETSVGFGSVARSALAWQRATVWANGVATDLGTLGGRDSEARALNSAGLIVGNSYTAPSAQGGVNGRRRAFVWQDGHITALPTLPGGRETGLEGGDINNHDQIVGWATAKTGKKHAVLWTLRNG
jgi:probable HAF family extracellular repeat protein